VSHFLHKTRKVPRSLLYQILWNPLLFSQIIAVFGVKYQLLSPKKSLIKNIFLAAKIYHCSSLTKYQHLSTMKINDIGVIADYTGRMEN
jgi:hypothetical protein